MRRRTGGAASSVPQAFGHGGRPISRRRLLHTVVIEEVATDTPGGRRLLRESCSLLHPAAAVSPARGKTVTDAIS
jgi:hypothetical protein